MKFNGRIVILGFGTIGQCLLPMLLDKLQLPGSRYLIIDGDDHLREFEPYRQLGIDYQVKRIESGNYRASLGSRLAAGDLLLNMSVGVNSIDVADWCHAHGICYVDTAIEPWEEQEWGIGLPPHLRTEYAYHQAARQRADESWRADGPTAVYTHGANPGLVSHFVKAALLEIAEAMKLDCAQPETREEWARLAQQTGTRVIHISERDTQISSEPKRTEEFVNTWSIPGFVEEATMPAEIGWGSHEKVLPPRARRHEAGPANAIYLETPGARLLLRSWVPLGGNIAGLALPHSECITLSRYLAVYEDAQVAYRPTVVFVYLPCDAALASLHETMMREWRIPATQRIMNEDIIAGRDELGVLLLGHEFGGWWYGSQLDIHRAREVVPGHNPTAIQVAAGALAAATWTMDNPNRGFCEPEDLPHREILEVARPYLEPMVSLVSDWDPLADRLNLFADPGLDRDDPWQFGNFVISG